MRPAIDLVLVDAGGGHRAAATAIEATIKRQARPWAVRLVDLQDVLDELDYFRKYARIRFEDVYNRMLEQGWTLGSRHLLRLMHVLIRACHTQQVRLLAAYWRRNPPDLVVSLVSNFNRALFEALRTVDSAIPFVTLLTDMADYPPNFWIERQEQIFICGTERACQQARATSPGSDVHRISGMVINPCFYDIPAIDVVAERTRIGLDPGRPTGLLLFGGAGSRKMSDVLRLIDRSSLDVQLIIVCGRNEKLRANLDGRPTRIRRVVEGFSGAIPRFMQISDFFIGKPGPGSISEAVHMGLPVIVERNAWTLPQERFNADWIIENDVGEVLTSFAELVPTLERTLAPGRLSTLKRNTRAIRNRGVFEVVDLLAEVLQRTPACVAAR